MQRMGCVKLIGSAVLVKAVHGRLNLTSHISNAQFMRHLSGPVATNPVLLAAFLFE